MHYWGHPLGLSFFALELKGHSGQFEFSVLLGYVDAVFYFHTLVRCFLNWQVLSRDQPQGLQVFELGRLAGEPGCRFLKVVVVSVASLMGLVDYKMVERIWEVAVALTVASDLVEFLVAGV